MNYPNIKIITRGAYDLQALRIQTGNRICANFRSKLGLHSSEKETELDSEKLNVLKELRKHYKLLTDGITSAKISPKNFTATGVISTYTEFVLLSHYFDLEKQEEKHFSDLEKVLLDFPIYTKFLKGIKGIGPAMAGVILSEIDIHKAKYPSSLWKLSGLDCAPDGKGRSKRKEHLIDKAYLDKDGKEQTKKSITFNPFLKTKLMGVLAGSFLKSKSPYSEIYYNMKNRYQNKPDWVNESKLHIHNAALRKMIKIFLIDLHMKWRELEGLEVSLPYHEAKLGIKHSHRVQENQGIIASHDSEENQAARASQNQKENQTGVASHLLQEPQNHIASQTDPETHVKEASSICVETHSKKSSHSYKGARSNKARQNNLKKQTSEASFLNGQVSPEN